MTSHFRLRTSALFALALLSFCSFTLLVSASAHAAPGIVDTIIGTGTPGYSGDGGPAESAQLNFPHATAVAANGDLYIGDTSNHRIRMVSAADGTVTTVAGTGVGGYSGDGGVA